jgi:hypothetical protein
MPGEQESKAPTPKEFAGWDYAGRVMLESRARIFSMWRLPLPSIYVDYTIG